MILPVTWCPELAYYAVGFFPQLWYPLLDDPDDDSSLLDAHGLEVLDARNLQHLNNGRFQKAVADLLPVFL